jgi:integrase
MGKYSVNKGPPQPTEGAISEEKEKGKLNNFIGQYLDYIKTTFADKTHENASRVLKLFLKYLGDKPLNEFGPRDLEEFKEIRKQDVKPVTVNIDVRTLKAAFEVAANWELIKNNPFSKVKQIRVEKEEPRYLRKKDLDEICNKIRNPQIRDIVMFAAATGLRRGEMLNLKWEDINWDDHSIRIQSGDVYKVKHEKLRYVPLNGLALEILNRQKQKASYVFPNRKGRALDADFVSRRFKDAIVSSNVSNDFRFHDLRSTFASWAISSGIPVAALLEILGHRSITTTQGYSKFDSDRLHREMEKFKIGDKPSKVDMDDLREILDSES